MANVVEVLSTVTEWKRLPKGTEEVASTLLTVIIKHFDMHKHKQSRALLVELRKAKDIDEVMQYVWAENPVLQSCDLTDYPTFIRVQRMIVTYNAKAKSKAHAKNQSVDLLRLQRDLVHDLDDDLQRLNDLSQQDSLKTLLVVADSTTPDEGSAEFLKASHNILAKATRNWIAAKIANHETISYTLEAVYNCLRYADATMGSSGFYTPAYGIALGILSYGKQTQGNASQSSD